MSLISDLFSKTSFFLFSREQLSQDAKLFYRPSYQRNSTTEQYERICSTSYLAALIDGTRRPSWHRRAAALTRTRHAGLAGLRFRKTCVPVTVAMLQFHDVFRSRRAKKKRRKRGWGTKCHRAILRHLGAFPHTNTHTPTHCHRPCAHVFVGTCVNVVATSIKIGAFLCAQ